MKLLQIENNFHGTSVRVRISDEDAASGCAVLSNNQERRVTSELCGMDCTCGQIRDRRVSDQGGILYFDQSALV